MTYTYNDIILHIPDLKKYVKSKIKTDWWKDVVQDVLVYLYIKFKSSIITNLKGFILNTAKMFINKYFLRNDKKLIYSNEILSNDTSNQIHVFMRSEYNTNYIDDTLYNNIKSVSKLIFAPFKMQLDDMSIKEIAQELDINENTVKTLANFRYDYVM